MKKPLKWWNVKSSTCTERGVLVWWQGFICKKWWTTFMFQGSQNFIPSLHLVLPLMITHGSFQDCTSKTYSIPLILGIFTSQIQEQAKWAGTTPLFGVYWSHHVGLCFSVQAVTPSGVHMLLLFIVQVKLASQHCRSQFTTWPSLQ